MQGEIVGINEISLGPGRRDSRGSRARGGRVDHARRPREARLDRPRSPAAADVEQGARAARSSAARSKGRRPPTPASRPATSSLKLAGRDVLVRFAEEVPVFNQLVMRLPIGKPVEATVLRDGAEKTLRVTPAERESVDARIRELPLVGITASNLTGWSAKELKRTSRDGVRVRGVRPGRPGRRSQAGAPRRRRDPVGR